MSSTVVKCANCNVVINELLAFVSNKISVMDDESLSKICVSAFSDSDIVTAKNLLFDSVSTNKKKITRKKNGKKLRDIDDIICLIRGIDSEQLPVFVAKDLEKLPPVLFDHVDVTRLLKDIVKLQQDVMIIREEFTPLQQFNAMRCEVEALRHTSIINSYQCNVNKKRGACLIDSVDCTSGPMGLLSTCNGSIITHDEHEQHTSPPELEYRSIQNNPQIIAVNECLQIEGSEAAVPKPLAMSHAIRPSGEQPRAVSPIPTHQCSPAINKQCTIMEPLNNDVMIPKQKSLASVVREGEWKSQPRTDDWIRVQRRKHRNRFIGQRGKANLDPESRFRAAETMIPLYVYNVAKDLSEEDICNYIKKKSTLEVKVVKMNMKIEKDYDSYKISVPKHKIEIFMSNDFWPDGIAYRRFIDFRKQDNLEVQSNNKNG